MYVVGKTWCHNAPDYTTEKKEYDTYEDAKAAYDRAVKKRTVQNAYVWIYSKRTVFYGKL